MGAFHRKSYTVRELKMSVLKTDIVLSVLFTMLLSRQSNNTFLKKKNESYKKEAFEVFLIETDQEISETRAKGF